MFPKLVSKPINRKFELKKSARMEKRTAAQPGEDCKENAIQKCWGSSPVVD